MDMTPKRAAALLVFTGSALVVVGVALIYPPLALVLTGGAVAAVGLLGIEVDEK